MGKSLQGKELGRGFYQRKDGRYEARAKVNGQSIDLINTSLTELRKDFEAAKKNLSIKAQPISVSNNNDKLSTWYNKWFKEFKAPQLKNEKSRNAMDRKCRNTYIELLGEKKLRDISQGDIQTATYQLLEKDITEKYIRDGLGVLKQCFEIALVNRLVEMNPCVCILFPNKNEYRSKDIRVLDNWELELFLQACKGSYYDEMYQIMISSGMRIGEVGGLQWENVDFANQVIRIRKSLITDYQNGVKIQKITTPKTANSYREIPFFGETANLFKRWKEKQDERKNVLGDRWRSSSELGDLVFTTIYGSPINKYVVQHDLDKVVDNMTILEKLNADKEHRLPREVQHIHPHVLRHTACSLFFMKGMDPVVVQRIMGHANYSTTLGYTHLLEKKKEAEIKKVGNFFENIG